jgi:hypothetical protein
MAGSLPDFYHLIKVHDIMPGVLHFTTYIFIFFASWVIAKIDVIGRAGLHVGGLFQ